MTASRGSLQPGLLRPALWTLVVGLALTPDTAGAQWLEEPGEGWVDATLYHLDTREAFGIDGQTRDFFADGHAVSTSVFLTVVGGLLPGVDAWVQVPYNRLRFEDTVSDRLRQGIGDTRLYLRTAPLRLVGSEFPLAVRGGVSFRSETSP